MTTHRQQSDDREFLSCDWGTSAFRLRRVAAASGRVLEEVSTDRGIRSFATGPSMDDDPAARASRCADYFAAQVDALGIAPARPISAVVSGMAASSIGWRELPYATAPFPLDGTTLPVESLQLTTRAQVAVTVWLASGVRTDSDMMRGEETQLIGLFADGRHSGIAPAGVVILPGTHSKHVVVRAGRVVALRTFMTGELFDVLAAHTVLRASVALSPEAHPATDEGAREAFAAGLHAARDTGLASSLFQVRTRTVLQQNQPTANRWFLSGLLIGAELVEGLMNQSDLPVLLAAPSSLSELYRIALQTLAPGEPIVVASQDEVSHAAVRGHMTLLARVQTDRDL